MGKRRRPYEYNRIGKGKLKKLRSELLDRLESRALWLDDWRSWGESKAAVYISLPMEIVERYNCQEIPGVIGPDAIVGWFRFRFRFNVASEREALKCLLDASEDELWEAIYKDHFPDDFEEPCLEEAAY